ncbi:MAG: M48 family metallopeptidase [Gammaproteobacteria bacterium]|nr:M48 family metallopeptidase [Gammaproteobacteria bacterium]
MFAKKYLIPTLLLTAVITACATSPTGRRQLMLVSPETAVSASKEAYVKTIAPLADEGKIDSDSELVKRVREITGRIVYQAIALYPNTADWGWEIKVIDDAKTINAWCMAGGKMALYTGLVDAVNPTDDELAQVMGHEVSHALANHTAEKMSVALATQIGMIGVAVAVQDKESSALVLTGASLAAATAITLPNSRAAEIESDELGMRLAALAGYNPAAAATLWEKMAKSGSGDTPEFLSTHPSPENRVATLKALAPKFAHEYQPRAKHPVFNFSKAK